LLAERPELRDRAVVIAEDRRGAARVVACCARAARAGVAPGMTLAEAAAVAGGSSLVVEKYDPLADHRALESLAARCERFSPLVGLEEAEKPASLFLDVGSVSHLLGGEEVLLQKIVEQFAGFGLRACVAMADTPGAAWAVAYGLERNTGGTIDSTGGTDDSAQSVLPWETTPAAESSLSRSDKRSANGRSNNLSLLRNTDDFPALPSVQASSVAENRRCYPRAIVPARRTVDALNPLPVEALRLPGEVVSLLAALGIHEIGQLLRLPREALDSRFGPELRRRLAEALGEADEPIRACRRQRRAAAAHTFDYPTAHRAALETQLRRLLGQLTGQLARRRQGVTRLRCEFFLEQTGSPGGTDDSAQSALPCKKTVAAESSVSRSDKRPVDDPLGSLSLLRNTDDFPALPTMLASSLAENRRRHPGRVRPDAPYQVGTFRFEVGLYEPIASAEDLFALAWLQVQRHFFSAPVATIRVVAIGAAALEYRQGDLFGQDRPDARRGLARLIDRLAARLGREAVLGVRLAADAQPERAYRYEPLAGRKKGTDAFCAQSAPGEKGLSGKRRMSPFSPRPLLLPRPVPLRSATSTLGNVPMRFEEHSQTHRVAAAWGPERIETGWWRGRGIARDYYRVETSQGHRLWLFRRLNDGKWFLHGRFQ